MAVRWRALFSIIGGFAFASSCLQVKSSGVLVKSGTLLTTVSSASPSPSPTPLSATFSLANTANAIALTSRANRVGTIYYAIFNSDQGTLTATQVKTYAQAPLGGALVAAGSVALATPNSDVVRSVAGLADKTLYTLYAVAESTDGLDANANVKKYAKVLPLRVSQQNYASAVAGGVGKTVRYDVYYPPGYYDHPADEYPLLIYLGGAGEIPSDAANPESIFTTGQYRIDKTPYVANIALGQTYPFVIVIPQCNGALFGCSGYSQTAWTHEVVTTVQSVYRVNQKRTYLVGMSNGGGGVWNYLIAHPEKVAAAIPIAAVSFSYTTGDSGTLCAAAKSPVAVWAVNNTNDGLVSPSYSVTGVTRWNACTGVVNTATHTMLPGNIFPATENTHFTHEYVLNSQWCRYSPSPAALDPGGVGRVPLEPGVVAQLATFSANMGKTIGTAEDWLLQFSKP